MPLTPYLPDVRAIGCLMAVSVSSARASEGQQPLHSGRPQSYDSFRLIAKINQRLLWGGVAMQPLQHFQSE